MVLLDDGENPVKELVAVRKNEPFWSWLCRLRICKLGMCCAIVCLILGFFLMFHFEHKTQTGENAIDTYLSFDDDLEAHEEDDDEAFDDLEIEEEEEETKTNQEIVQEFEAMLTA